MGAIDNQIALFNRLVAAQANKTPSSQPTKATRRRLDRHKARSTEPTKKKSVPSLLDCSRCGITYKRHLLYEHEYHLRCGKIIRSYLCVPCDAHVHDSPERESFHLRTVILRVCHSERTRSLWLREPPRGRSCKLLYDHIGTSTKTMGRLGQGVATCDNPTFHNGAANSPITPTQ